MVKEIFGKKIGMTQLFDEAGDVRAVTLVEVEPACILEKVDYATKTVARIGCFKVSSNRINKVKKPVLGYFNKLGIDPYKLIREVEIETGADFAFLEKKEETKEEIKEKPVAEAKEVPAQETQEVKEATEEKPEDVKEKKSEEASEQPTQEENKEPAQQEVKEEKPAEDTQEPKEEVKEEPKQEKNPREIGIDLFNVGDIVDVRAKTKGRGFAGGMKRHNWAGQPSAHGSTMHRRIGSAGMCAFPGEILKGTRMPGHMGDAQRTIKNLKVVRVDADKNVLFIEGAVPGARGTVVKLKKIKAA